MGFKFDTFYFSSNVHHHPLYGTVLGLEHLSYNIPSLSYSTGLITLGALHGDARHNARRSKSRFLPITTGRHGLPLGPRRVSCRRVA